MAGRGRSAYLAGRLGTALREARLARGLRQRDVGVQAGVSQPEIAKLESGDGANTGLGTWASCGLAVGLQLAAFFEAAPGADLPRDMQHLRRQNLVIVVAQPGGWRGEPESALTGDGPRPRSIDVLLTRAIRREAAVCEIWDFIPDGGAVMRGLETKVLATRQRLGSEWRVQGLLVVRGTSRNRSLVHELGALFAARYPGSSTAWLRCLGESDVPMPDAAGLVWTDVRGDRLIAARLRR